MAIYKRGGTYWFTFTFDGRRVQKSTRQHNRKAAVDIEAAYRTKLAKDEVGIGPPKRERRTIAELLDLLKSDYERDGKLSPQNRSLLDRASEDFGTKFASKLAAEEIEKYVQRRKAEGAAHATVNRVTDILRRAYKLAGLTPPKRVHLSEKNNVRRGFFSEDDFRALHACLPDDLKDFCRFAYLTGWRSREIRTLEWSDVEERTIRLRGENAKNREPRCIVSTGELPGILERRQQERLVDGVLTSLVFHRQGQPIGEFKRSWATACVAAGLGKITCPKCGEPGEEGQWTRCSKCKKQRTYRGKIFHDFRRTAVRNLVRAGVPETTCMKITGHKTRSMFDRYNITSEGDLAEAMERVEKFHQATPEKVVAIAK
jgi:integrase